MHSIASVFCTPIYINIINTLSDSDVDFIKELDYYGPNAGGNLTSSNLDILNHEKLSNLKQQIEENLNLYIANVMAPTNDIKLRITQSWANKNPKNTGHHKHNHSNSIVSGVFYISPNPAPILFEQTLNSPFRVDSNKSTPFNTESYKVNCSKNMLVLFPSHLQHYVETNQTDEERISIAFNTFYTGTFGQEKSLTFLEIK